MNLFNPCNVDRELMMKSLIGYHCFTGCDTVSSFASRGKIKPLNLMIKNQEYIECFSEIGVQSDVSSDLMDGIERFVSHMYGGRGCEANELRYQLYCKSRGRIGCENLPPCRNVLLLHTRRANYQAHIWRDSLVQIQEQLDPTDYGWMTDDSGCLDIEWMTCKPAPDEVFKNFPMYLRRVKFRESKISRE